LPSNQHFASIIWNKDPKFKSIDSLKFELDTLSPAIGSGRVDIGKLYPLDLKNKNRTLDTVSDLGAYERVNK